MELTQILQTASSSAIIGAALVYVFKLYIATNAAHNAALLARVVALEAAVKECDDDRRILHDRFTSHLIEEATKAVNFASNGSITRS